MISVAVLPLKGSMDATKSPRERRLVKSFVVMASQKIIRKGANGLEFSVLSSIRHITETGINSLNRVHRWQLTSLCNLARRLYCLCSVQLLYGGVRALSWRMSRILSKIPRFRMSVEV